MRPWLSLLFLLPACATGAQWQPSAEPMEREIALLTTRIDGKDDQEDLSRFWARMDRIGSPIIARSSTDSRKMTVTFVWRGTGKEIESPVGVFAEFNQKPWQDGDPLTNIAGTDVWYRSYELDARVAQPYVMLTRNAAAHGQPVQRLYTNDEGPGEAKSYQLFLDPRNRRTLQTVYWGEKSFENFFVGPDASGRLPREFALRKPSGVRMAEHWLPSSTLGNTRRIWIQRTSSPRGTAAPALLIFFDGKSYIHAARTPEMLERLAAARKIGPTLAVYLDTIDLEHRFRELCRPDGHFSRYVADELLPFVTAETGMTFAAQDTVLAGASCGGLAASHIATLYPEKFGGVIGQSSAFWLGPTAMEEHADWLLGRVAAAPADPVRFHLSYGAFENSDDIVLPNRRFAAGLKERRYPVCILETPGYHTFLDWSMALEPAILAQLSGRSGKESLAC